MSRASAPLLEIDALRVRYGSPRGSVVAIRDAVLDIREGEAVGLVGESGSGKSTLARAALGLLPARTARIEQGRLVVGGTDMTRASAAQWERTRGSPVAIVFQDPLSFLNPVMRIGRQIDEGVVRHDPQANPRARVAELLDLVRLPQGYLRSYPHELSGGMRQRVLLAIALGCRPRLLVADEPTTALDVTTQAEILALLSELRTRLGMSLLLISHDLAVVSSACSRVYVMYSGYTVETGTAAAVFSRPAHPYTQALVNAAGAARDATGRFVTVEGERRSATDDAPGCPFAGCCARVSERCLATMPPFTVQDPAGAHRVRCWAA
jgi:oligopeptide/dipeptide ABC transporter ATP-binding protein